MNSGYSASTNDLDHIRRSQGINACRNLFRKLEKERRQNAITLVNDSSLIFTSLFILQPEIENLNMRGELSGRNQLALNICKKILEENNGDLIPLNSEDVHHVLIWMFNTGVADDGLDNEFDQVLDIVVSILIKTHHENAILPVMIDMIFKRNQKGRYIHDLVWACFQTRDVNALRLIAGYLRSSVSKDVDLARTLLSLPKNIPLRTSSDKQKQYAAYLLWLKENDPYLCFTGECLQCSNNPIPCFVDLEAKYLCKDNCLLPNKQLNPLTDTERACLNNFNKLPENEKTVLAKYSQKLHSDNPKYWNQWMEYPVDTQINLAQYSGGNQNDCHCR